MESTIDDKKSSLKVLLEQYLKRGDKAQVARKHKVRRNQVTRVLQAMNVDSPILKDLVALASGNKKKADAISKQIDKLK